MFQNVLGRGIGRGNGYPDSPGAEAFDDIALYAIVDNDDVRIGMPGAVSLPGVARFDGGVLGQILSDQTGRFRGAHNHLVGIEDACFTVDDNAVLRAFFAQMAGYGARVHIADTDHAVVCQPGREVFLGAIIGGLGHGVAQHAAQGPRRGRFHVVPVGAHIADMREGKGDDLARVRRIGENFLIARHGGVKAQFALHAALYAQPLAVEYPAVGQGQGRAVPNRRLRLAARARGSRGGLQRLTVQRFAKGAVAFIVALFFLCRPGGHFLKKIPQRPPQFSGLVELDVADQAEIVQFPN